MLNKGEVLPTYNTDALHGLRFVFVALLMIQHMLWPVVWGGMVVTFFLTIGGFLTAYNNCRKNVTYTRENSAKYYIGKVKKLYPLYLIATICELVRMVYFRVEIPWKALTLHLLLVKTWFPAEIESVFALGGANWYISTMMSCYLATPLLYSGAMKLYQKRKKPGVMLVAALILYLVQLGIVLSIKAPLEEYSVYWWFVYLSPFRIVEYSIGMLVGIWYANIEHNTDISVMKSYIFSALEIGTIFIMIFMYHVGPRVSGYITIGMYWTWLYVAMIVLVAEGKGIISRFLATKPMVYLGKLNFVLYIMHQHIYAFIMVCFGGSIYYQEGDPLNVVKTIFLFIVVIGVCDLLNKVMNVISAKRKVKLFR